MTRQCRTLGCTDLTTRYGAYCTNHKTVKRRHGDPEQRGITRSDLKPYRVEIKRKISESQGKAIWSLLDDRWISLATHVEILARTSMNKRTRKAAQEVSKLVVAVEPREVVETVLALYMMADQDRHMFRSDQAFQAQLVRRVRGLTEANATFSTSGTTGRRARVYTDLPPKVVEVMASWIIGTLGQAGVWIARQEQQSQEKRRQEALSLDKALTELSS